MKRGITLTVLALIDIYVILRRFISRLATASALFLLWLVSRFLDNKTVFYTDTHTNVTAPVHFALRGQPICFHVKETLRKLRISTRGIYAVRLPIDCDPLRPSALISYIDLDEETVTLSTGEKKPLLFGEITACVD